jgi:hypothetical protein
MWKNVEKRGTALTDILRKRLLTVGAGARQAGCGYNRAKIGVERWSVGAAGLESPDRSG